MCSSSWCVVHQVKRSLLFVNAGPGDPLDYLMEIKPQVPAQSFGRMSWIHGYSEGLFKTMAAAVDDDGRPYTMFRLVFTVDKEGSVVSASYLHYNSQGQVLDFVDTEYNSSAAPKMARILLHWEGIINGLPKAIEEDGTCKDSKVDDDGGGGGEICVICHEEYRAGDMIGAVHCKHRFHDECIKKWVIRKRQCPLCRNPVHCILLQKHNTPNLASAV